MILFISCMGKVVDAFVCVDGVDGLCDGDPKFADGTYSNLVQKRLEFGKCHLDRIEVRRMGRAFGIVRKTEHDVLDRKRPSRSGGELTPFGENGGSALTALTL